MFESGKIAWGIREKILKIWKVKKLQIILWKYFTH